PESTPAPAATDEAAEQVQEAQEAAATADVPTADDPGAPETETPEAETPEQASEPDSPTPQTEDLVREGEIAADFLEGLLDIADLAGDLEVDIEGARAAVAIVDSE